MIDTPALTHIVYLLHFEPAFGVYQHYCGITGHLNFKRRMRDHVDGHGARLVKRAVDAHCKVYRVRKWSVAGFEAEQRIKQNGHFKEKCPICNPRLAAELPEIELLVPGPLSLVVNTPLINWTQPRPEKQHPTNRKDRTL